MLALMGRLVGALTAGLTGSRPPAPTGPIATGPGRSSPPPETAADGPLDGQFRTFVGAVAGLTLATDRNGRSYSRFMLLRPGRLPLRAIAFAAAHDELHAALGDRTAGQVRLGGRLEERVSTWQGRSRREIRVLVKSCAPA